LVICDHFLGISDMVQGVFCEGIGIDRLPLGAGRKK
jgi:hypothetical protein